MFKARLLRMPRDPRPQTLQIQRLAAKMTHRSDSDDSPPLDPPHQLTKAEASD